MTAADEVRVGLIDRCSDRLNPLLVREVQQVLRGRAFLIVLSLALAAIAVIALVVAAEGEATARLGREAFVATLIMLVPIAIFLVPLQAFLSMQQELRGGLGEQLMLSKLTPRRIVLGKLSASLLLLGVFLSVFGPLLALTFLLRGVDVATIVFFIVMSGLTCLGASAFGVAMGAITRVRQLSPLMFAVTAIALGGTTAGMMGAMWDLVRELSGSMRSSDFMLAMGATVTAMTAGIVLLVMTACSLLTHTNENRSTAFRLFAVACIAVTYTWIQVGVPAREYDEAAPALAAFGFPLLAVMWLFATTEEERLSPRVVLMVPRNRWLARLAAPFLPGGGRGVLFVLWSGALLVALSLILQLQAPSWRGRLWTFVALSACYCFLYCALGRFIRARLRSGPSRTWITRITVPAVLVAGCAVPALIEVMISGRIRSWSPLHISNPFWTIDEAWNRDLLAVLLSGAVAVVLLTLIPTMRRGLREVVAASAERRARAD